MKIVVNQEDIRCGVRVDDALCPIALAIRRQTGRSVRVGLCGIEFDGDPSTDIETPRYAKDFNSAFDQETPVHPFEFDLEIPAKNP